MSLRRLALCHVLLVALLLLSTRAAYAGPSAPPDQANPPRTGAPAAPAWPALPAGPANTITAVAVRSWSHCDGTSVLWDSLNANWSQFGTTPIHIDYDYPGLCSGTITYSALVASGADVVIISDPAGGMEQYSAAEIDAIRQYAQAGHALLGTYLLFQWSSIDNRGLAPLFGIPGGLSFIGGSYSLTPTYDLIEPDNPLFRGLTNPYVSSGYPQTQTPADDSWDASDLVAGAKYVAKTADHRAAIITYAAANYDAVYITHMPEYLGSDRDQQFLYNAITYAGGGGETEDVPIIFIPGLMGSRLFNTLDGQEKEVWADVEKISSLLSNPHPLMVLQLASDGKTPGRDEPAYKTLHTVEGTAGMLTRLKGKAWGQSIDEDFYDSTVKHFTDQGYVEGVDFWVYPYDWRKDLRTSATELDTLVDKIIAQTGHAQVSIVAHSLGGLVTRQYISDAGRAGKVRKAVILGTPFLGTPQAFYVLQEGECMQKLPVIGYCIPKKHVLKALAPNFPAFYQIMPSETYMTVKGGGFYGKGEKIDVAGKCEDCLTYAETYSTAIASDLNTTLATDAKAFHTALDGQSAWNGVPVTIIAGQNQNTLVGIRQYTRRSWLGLVTTTIRQPVYTTAGDGTVAGISVSLASDDTGLNLRGSANFTTFDVNHGDLARNSTVLEYVDGELGIGSVAAQPAAPVVAVNGAQIVALGVSAIHVYDAEGRHTGPAPTGGDDVEQAIPGSAYFSEGDMATVALVGGRNYVITATPAGSGPVDITLVRSTPDETLESQLYLGIEATPASRITLTGDPFVADTWQFDVTGTGTDVQDVPPSASYTPDTPVDTTPPATTFITLEGTLGPNGWYVGPVTVRLAAIDNAGGSGIARIEYAFSNDRRVRTYTGPFSADPARVSVLYAAAVDNMGNAQVTFSRARIGPDRMYLPVVIR